MTITTYVSYALIVIVLSWESLADRETMSPCLRLTAPVGVRALKPQDHKLATIYPNLGA